MYFPRWFYPFLFCAIILPTLLPAHGLTLPHSKGYTES
jgi:hypothetical protein